MGTMSNYCKKKICIGTHIGKGTRFDIAGSGGDGQGHEAHHIIQVDNHEAIAYSALALQWIGSHVCLGFLLNTFVPCSPIKHYDWEGIRSNTCSISLFSFRCCWVHVQAVAKVLSWTL